MLKYFFTLLLPVFLSANLTYENNLNKEIALLESFDIESSFLYDEKMNDMRLKNASKYREQHFFQAMDEAYLFIPSVKNILAEYEIPPEFLYLAMAESNFSNSAHSKKAASGLWQFMPVTAKLYGLKIDEYVDERRDLAKSTKAAAKYLSALHQKFGKWYLAAIAYNCGDGKLSRAIIQAGTDDLNVLLDEDKKYIPLESRLYIRKVISLALAGNDEEFLLNSEYSHLLNRANAYSVSTVKLSSGASLKRLSKLVGMPLEEIRKLNRHLKYDFVPPYPNGYDVYIPYIKLAEFKQKYHEDKEQNNYKIHTVGAKESLSKISAHYGVNYDVIMDFNNLTSAKVKPYQKLIIPIDDALKIKKVDNKFYHKVKKGDTLDSISEEYKISVRNIILQNHIVGEVIKIGDRLKIQ